MTRRPGGGVHHALIADSRGVWGLDRSAITRGPITSVKHLELLLDHVRTRELLAPCGAAPQLWLVGNPVCEALGWSLAGLHEDEQAQARLAQAQSQNQARAIAKHILSERIVASLQTQFESFDMVPGWTIRRGRDVALGDVDPGAMVPLVYRDREDGRPFRLDVFIEPEMWTLTGRDDLGVLGSERQGTALPEDEAGTAAELARRLRWMIDHLGVLPSATSSMIGAGIQDDIMRQRRRWNSERKEQARGAVVEQRSPLPTAIAPEVIIEAPVEWSRTPTVQELSSSRLLMVVDQRASYLASAGTLELGWGEPKHVNRATAEQMLSADKIAFGVWKVELPALAEINADPRLPAVLPPMRYDRRVTAWITTESVHSLLDPVSDGGAGLEVDDLLVDEGYVYPERGRALEAWTKRLRQARTAAVDDGDQTMKKIVGSIYKSYVGRIANPDMWRSQYKAHHFQPMWHYAIIADARRRGRRQVMKLVDQHQVWPIASRTDSWTFLCQDSAGFADPTGYLGRLDVEKQAELDEGLRQRLSAGSIAEAVALLRPVAAVAR